MLDFSEFEDLKGLVADYKLNVVDMDSITNENSRFANSECMKMLNTFVVSKELKNYIDDNCGEKGVQKTMCRAITELIEDGRIDGRKEGRLIVNKLTAKLIDEGRLDDLKRATTDQEYQDDLIKAMFPDDWKQINANSAN